jgi:hypothetical protein
MTEAPSLLERGAVLVAVKVQLSLREMHERLSDL